MTRLGIYSFNLTESKNEFFQSIASYSVLIILTMCVVSSSVFVYKNPSELGLVLAALYVSIGCIQCIGAHVNIGLNMNETKALHLKLQEIVDKGLSLLKIKMLD